MEIVIKTTTGDCGYVTVQEFRTIDDAYNELNPLTEPETKATDVRINNIKYKLKPTEKMSEQFDTKIARLSKRFRGLSRILSAMNDLYLYGIYESNFPKLMEDINRTKDHLKKVVTDTKEEIEMSGDGLTIKDEPVTSPLEPDPEAADIDTAQSLREKGLM